MVVITTLIIIRLTERDFLTVFLFFVFFFEETIISTSGYNIKMFTSNQNQINLVLIL